ncbi:hypothetical protein SRHO_G00215360 [Serrasalmus rhombeus]
MSPRLHAERNGTSRARRFKGRHQNRREGDKQRRGTCLQACLALMFSGHHDGKQAPSKSNNIALDTAPAEPPWPSGCEASKQEWSKMRDGLWLAP